MKNWLPVMQVFYCPSYPDGELPKIHGHVLVVKAGIPDGCFRLTVAARCGSTELHSQCLVHSNSKYLPTELGLLSISFLAKLFSICVVVIRLSTTHSTNTSILTGKNSRTAGRPQINWVSIGLPVLGTQTHCPCQSRFTGGLS